MRKWIRKLLNLDEQELRQIFSAEKGSLRVQVREYTRDCGHAGHFVELFVGCEKDLAGQTEFAQVACIHWSDVPFAIELMQQASDAVAGREGLRPLPTVRLWGKSFFVDDRLSELRNVEDPHERVLLQKNQ